MNFKTIAKAGKVAALACMFACLGCVDSLANLDGRWLRHPAATLRTNYKTDQVDRIIDGNRYVYFSVRGGYLNRTSHFAYTTVIGKDSSGSFSNVLDPLHLFRYDKTQPWGEGCILPVADEIEMSGNFHTVVNYSPEHEVLAVIYEEGIVDFIYDNGTLISSSAVKDIATPIHQSEAYSVTFDDTLPLAYIAGGFGLVTVDIRTGDVKEHADFGQPVAWGGRVGTRMVVIAGDIIKPRYFNKGTATASATYKVKAYSYPVGNNPSSLNSPINNSDNIQALMPLGDNVFAAIAPSSNSPTSDTSFALRVFVFREDGTVETSNLADNQSVDLQAAVDFRHMFRTDGFFSPTKEGFSIYSNANIYLLKKGVPYVSAAEFKSQALTTLSKSSFAAEEKKAKAATFDGSGFWLYDYAKSGLDGTVRGFYSKNYEGGKWQEQSSTVTPSGPTNTFAVHAEWSPIHGMIFRGPGSGFSSSSTERDNFYSYKDGKWTDLTYAANNSKYEGITIKAKYVGIDPLNPNWIWGCVNSAGLLRMDLSDFNKFLMIGHYESSKYETTYPGYFSLLEDIAYSGLCSFSNVAFDSENRMWFAKYVPFSGSLSNVERQTLTELPIYHYTAEERLQMADIGANKEMAIAPHEMVIKGTVSYHNSRLIALHGENTKNILVFMPIHFTGVELALTFIDHNGTPDDTSDDKVVFVRELTDDRGMQVRFNRYTGLHEDSVTGEVWFCTVSGVYIIDPEDIMAGNMVCRRPHVSRKYGEPADDYPLEQVAVNDIAVDILGRKWVSSEQGLFCFSADGDELLGFYNTMNSIMPSDGVMGVGCDGKTGSVFVLTEKGMVEFQPEGSLASVAEGDHLTIWPSTVTPYYTGYVSITGADNGCEYFVFDKEGNEVASLGKPADGHLQWDCRGSNIPAGKYDIRRKDNAESHPVIIVGK